MKSNRTCILGTLEVSFVGLWQNGKFALQIKVLVNFRECFMKLLKIGKLFPNDQFCRGLGKSNGKD